MLKIIFIFIALSLTVLGGVRDDCEQELRKIEKQYNLRIEKDYSTQGMVEAAQDYYENLDVLLNKYYQELMTTLDDEQKKALRESQREWIKFRDKELRFIGELYSKMEGTIWRLYIQSSKIELIKNRVKKLVGYLANQKNEL